LSVPEEIQLDYIVIREADSIAEAYDAGQNATNAKYKVYLNENVFLVNPDFIGDILDIFSANPKVGMVGALGYTRDDTGFIHREGSLLAEGNETKCVFYSPETQTGLRIVDFLDSNLLVTSYDVEWLPEGDSTRMMEHQSEKMRQQGYQSVVLLQDKPWCLYDNYLIQETVEERGEHNGR
jgi:hypothetical protein